MKLLYNNIVIAMSGGVDSSIAAYLLKEKYKYCNIIGVHIQSWNDQWSSSSYCTQSDDMNDAIKTANCLSIPLYSYDLSNVYYQKVWEYTVEQLKKGDTPNPDMLCNRYIKFGALYDALFKKECQLYHPIPLTSHHNKSNEMYNILKNKEIDYLATGHYAKTNNNLLYQAIDKSKEQSFFLSYIKKDCLNKVLFPLGEKYKKNIRKLALENNIPTANKKDSTGLCFVGPRSYSALVSEYITNQPGSIITIDNKIIGEHNGIFYYTIGQRCRIGGLNSVHYVVAKCFKTNRIIVSSKRLYMKSIELKKFNSLTLKALTEYKNIGVQLRNLKAIIPCEHINVDESTQNVHITTKVPLESPSPGQTAVLYSDVLCLGGGIISYDNPYLK